MITNNPTFEIRLTKPFRTAMYCNNPALEDETEPLKWFSVFAKDGQWDDEYAYTIRFVGKTVDFDKAQEMLENAISQWDDFVEGHWEYD